MKKFLLFSLLFTTLSAFANEEMVGMPNPWTDCANDINKAAEIAGFDLPIDVEAFTFRASKGMIEAVAPISNNRDIIIRKSAKKDGINRDNSGDYNVYPMCEKVSMNGNTVTLRRDEKLVYVMYFSTPEDDFSIQCKDGLTMGEVEKFHRLIWEYKVNDDQNWFTFAQ